MAAADKVDAILARFPGPVTLRVNRLRAAGVLAISLAFVAVCIFLLHARPTDFDALDVVMTWAGLVFFGAGAAIMAVMLLPGAGSLTLAADGFEMCSLFRRHRTPWRQASDFTIGRFRQRGMRPLVAYEDAKLTGFAADTSRSLVGRNAALPDTYGLSHAELVRLLTQWRKRALGETRHSPVPRIAAHADAP
jgi:hypothetical protein